MSSETSEWGRPASAEQPNFKSWVQWKSSLSQGSDECTPRTGREWLSHLPLDFGGTEYFSNFLEMLTDAFWTVKSSILCSRRERIQPLYPFVDLVLDFVGVRVERKSQQAEQAGNIVLPQKFMMHTCVIGAILV